MADIVDRLASDDDAVRHLAQLELLASQIADAERAGDWHRSIDLKAAVGVERRKYTDTSGRYRPPAPPEQFVHGAATVRAALDAGDHLGAARDAAVFGLDHLVPSPPSIGQGPTGTTPPVPTIDEVIADARARGDYAAERDAIRMGMAAKAEQVRQIRHEQTQRNR